MKGFTLLEEAVKNNDLQLVHLLINNYVMMF